MKATLNVMTMKHWSFILVGGGALLFGGACGDDGGFNIPDARPLVPDPDAPEGNEDASPGADASPDADPSIDAMSPDAGEPSDLVLHYEFEGTGTVVSDSSGRDLHGTLSDVNARTTDGRIGSALSMSADDTQYVELPDGVLDGVDDFTIAVWVKYDVLGPWSRIYDFGNGLTDPANRFMYLTPHAVAEDGSVIGTFASSYGGSPQNESILTTAGTQLPTSVWKHIAVTGSGGERTIYIDGFPAAHVTGQPDVPPSEMEPIGGQSWLGHSRFPADPGFGGTMDDFRIYNRVLTATEIADLAAPGQDYSYWRFDEGTGTDTVDSSGHAIPTTLAEGATWDADGRMGAAVSLPGAVGGGPGPHVVLGTNPVADCTEELTVAAWVKLGSLDAWARIFDFGRGLGQDAESFIYLAPTDGTGTRFAMVAPTGAFDMIAPSPLLSADSAWHHIAVTVAADGTVTMYADGTSAHTDVSDVVTPGDLGELTELWLGKSRFPDSYLNGSIDELRISCRAYTADEIKNLSYR